MKKIDYIYCENTMQQIWDTFLFLENIPSVNKFLSEKYKKNNYSNYHHLALNNTCKFIYFIKQAKEYSITASNSPLLIKPLLTYYGMMSFIKALIITKDPYYPKQTSLLRHGITTRKLKRNNFSFHSDEVRVQKEGLLPLFYTTITNTSSDIIQNQKFKVKDLLSYIPELHISYNRLFNEQLIYPINIDKELKHSKIEFSISKNILNHYSKDLNKLLSVLNNQSESNFIFKSSDLEYLTFIWDGKIENPTKYENFFNHPSIIQDYKGKYYFRYLSDETPLLPVIVVNYMLMYNLGILCRYDTELWGKIIFSFSSEDIYIINELINLSLHMFPNLILNHLLERKLIFIQ